MSGDCGHGWGHHFLGSRHECFACLGYWTREDALEAVLTLTAEKHDLQARLKAARGTSYAHEGVYRDTATALLDRATDLRRRKWRKP